MSGGGSRHVGAPRTLDVQKFANARGVEVQSLHAVLKDKKVQVGSDVGTAIPRCLRRRTTSHNRRKSFFWRRKTKKRKPEGLDGVPVAAINAESRGADTGSDEVAVPAKRPLCRRVRRKIELKGDENGGGGCSRDGTQRLVTHVWHAKRFTMTKIWGHWLAKGLPGRGRGSRAVISWKDKAALLHDASFYSAIELEGSEKSIMEALQLVLEPAPPRSFKLISAKDFSVYSGAEYGKAMLHHLGRSPRGAISPVTYMWRRKSNVGEERRIWLWVHAAAFEEALACLQLLCQIQGIDGKDRLQCWSRKGQFGRLDLLGSKAISVLKKVLHPVARSTSQGGVDSSFHSFSDGAVIEMEVWDPRCPPDSDTKFEPSFLLDADFDENGADDLDLVGQKSKHSPTLNQLDVNSTDIWGRSGPTRQEGIVMPLSEKDVSSRRHKKRLSYIHLNDDTQAKQTATNGNSKCSVVVLQHDYRRFSLILPIGWVRAFWVPLVFAGGHVIGLRERHWLQTDAKLPSFPHDYPDCYSYDQHMAEKSAEYQEIYNRKPPSKRGLWKNELLGWEFAHEAALSDSGKYISTPEASGADFRAEIPCGTVAADSITYSSKTANSSLAALSSAGSEAPSAQLNFCSSAQEVLMDDRGPNDDSGVSESVTENSLIVLNMPLSDTLVSSLARDLTAQTIGSDVGADCSIVPVGVLQEGQRDDNTVELHGESSPQPDPASSSQPMAIADEEQERKTVSSAADLEACTSAHDVALALDTQGEAGNNLTSIAESELLAIMDRREFKGIDTGESPMFVARTSDTLQQFLKDDSLHHLPFFAKVGEKLLSNGHPGSQLADDGSAELLKKGCLVRVLIHAPRKGVFDEGAIIYLPLACDVNSYFQSSPRWQGFEDPSFKQVEQSHNPSRQTALPELRSECCNLRVSIGIVTSASVRGSSSSASIGICEIAGLGVLRARQMADERWDSIPEIFLLVRNKCSSMYRPALVSIVAETGDDLE